MRRLPVWLPLVACLPLTAPPAAASSSRALAEWRLQSAAKLAEKGEALSRPDYDDAGWHAVRVPNTVVGALVENGHFKDPYFGMNLRSIPGTTYPIGQRFTLLPRSEEHTSELQSLRHL